VEKGGSGASPEYDNPTRVHAEKAQAELSGQAERSGDEKFGGLPRIQHGTPTRRRKPSAATRPSATKKGDSGVSPGYDNPTRTHAKEGQAERSCQAERSGKGGFGVSPD
jgi:hypothetical protein